MQGYVGESKKRPCNGATVQQQQAYNERRQWATNNDSVGREGVNNQGARR